MNIDIVTRGIMIAQCLAVIEEAEATLDELLKPPMRETEDICDECRGDIVVDRLHLN